MKKEKVFIVVTHKHSLKNRHSKTESPDDWQVTETVEFVSQLRNKHYSFASIIGDYINRKIVLGTSKGITDYSKFEDYIRTKYPKEVAEIDSLYKEDRVPVEDSRQEVYSDQFGNIRPKTVFDPL